MTDSDSKRNEKVPLDLGLSQLAGREKSLDVSSYVADLERTRSSRSEEIETVEEETVDSVVCMTGIESLDASIEVEDWQDVIRRAEKNFSGDDENHRVRLWWLKAQLLTETMPPSLLTAPLQSVGAALQKEADDDVAMQFLEDIASELSIQLKDSKDYSLAVSVLELLSSINSDHESSHRETFNTLITEERSRLGPRASREMKERVKRLETRYEEQFGEEFQEQAPEKEILLKDVPEGITIDKHEAERSSSSGWYIILLLLLLGSAYWSGVFEGAQEQLAGDTSTGQEVADEAVVRIAYTIEAPEVKIPETSIVDVMRKPSLHGILKELDKQLTNPSSIIAQTGSGGTIAGTPRTAVARASNTPAVATSGQTKKRNGKKALDMSGPAEPRTVSEIIRDSKQRPEVSPRVPQRLYSGRLRGESRGNTIVSGYPTIPRFGRGQQVAEGRGEPYFYRIVYETPVKSAPSDASQTIGYLKIGNKVEVGERIGPWLRIVSSRSRSGYILANTAKPIQGPYS